jgi:hypothetical protein
VAEFTTFGSGAPASLVASGDNTAINVGFAFYVLGVTGRRVAGIRFYVPAGTASLPSSGFTGYIFDSSTGGNSANRQLASLTFPSTIAAGQWNFAYLSSPIAMTAGKYYWATVHFPSGKYGVQTNVFTASKQSVDVTSLWGASTTEVSPSNGSFSTGAAGSAPTTNSTTKPWYGVDVIVDDGSGGGGTLADTVGIVDDLTASRAGLPTTIGISASVTDPFGLSDSDSKALTVGGSTGVRAISRSLLGNRIAWGSAVDATIQGPTLEHDSSGHLTLGVTFSVQWACRVTSIRIYKHPDAAGSVPVTLYGPTGTVLASTTVTWVVDAGGWRTVTFPSPVTLAVATNYTAAYFSPNGYYAWSAWVYNAQDTVVPPFEVPRYQTSGVGGSAFNTGASATYPTSRTAHNYYIDPIVAWDDLMPGFDGGTDYLGQWVNGQSSFAFPVAVFFPDVQFIADYASIGVNTIISTGTPLSQAKVDAVKTAGVDLYASAEGADLTPARYAGEDSAFAARLKGYFLNDEPDMQVSGYEPPAAMRGFANTIRGVDSTRPILMNLGKWPPLNQGFAWAPSGATPQVANQSWRDFMAISDIVSCDFYNMTDENRQNRFGIWTYGRITRRMMELCDGRKPIWAYVETTSETPDQPTPEQVYRATWAHLIAGARGIVFFDHRFADPDVTQDFAALLHNTPMRTAVTNLAALLQTLGPALHAPDAGLVTANTSSNTTAGPIGGTYGVPLNYTTRVVGATTYLFAQASRPGSTTATFTIPAAAGKTLTVIGESRTVVANGSGVISDDFSSGDYTTHLYSWAT